mmetsp:Transcript_35681/g.54597  ORF Transcript_35681/g.54597 Transcript_35681/m.54597 type:complete len:222 (-) Transcript_35681:3226-3891(-)
MAIKAAMEKKLVQMMAKKNAERRARAAKRRPGDPEDSMELTPSEEERELRKMVRDEAILEWEIEMAGNIQKMQEKIGKVRNKYKRRHERLEKKLRAHILKDKQKDFVSNFRPAQYHKNMMILSDKKKKELTRVLDIMEQYDFFFRNLMMTELIKDQQAEKNPNLRSVIQLEFDLPDVVQAMVNYEEFEQQLFYTFDMGSDQQLLSRIDIALENYPKVTGLF